MGNGLIQFRRTDISARHIKVTINRHYISDGLGVSWTFILFSIICAISVVFIFSFVPETKNRTLEQVSADMKNRYEGSSGPSFFKFC